jgi:hypothetical protein
MRIALTLDDLTHLLRGGELRVKPDTHIIVACDPGYLALMNMIRELPNGKSELGIIKDKEQ